MSLPEVTEKNAGTIVEVVLGATAADNGTRSKTITIGGQNVLPFHAFEGTVPNVPSLAMEIVDEAGEDYPKTVRDAVGDVVTDVVAWAKACEEKFGADALCLKLKSLDPEGTNASIDDAVKTIENVLKATTLPLIIYGCGDDDKDMALFQAAVDVVKNERVAFGAATQDKYKSIAAVAMSANAAVIAFSNIDINLAKQLNILLTDFGMKKEKIIMDPLMGALGYGLDYSYSVMERIRIGAMTGDAMLQMPMICDSSIAWNAKEATSSEPIYSDELEKRGVMWETVTAMAALTAGADMLIMRHPEAVAATRKALAGLYGTEGA